MSEPEVDKVDRQVPPDGPDVDDAERQPPRGVRLMAIVRWLLVIAVALLAVWSVVYYLRGRGKAGGAPTGHLHGTSGGGGATGDAGVSAPGEQLWYCPMHPNIVRTEPGECPICHMDLEPMDTGSHAGHGQSGEPVPGLAPIQLTPDRIQLIGMRTAPVARRRLVAEIRTVGTVTARETGLARVDTRFAGWVQSLAVNQTGVKVAKGQLLATLNSPDLVTAQQELLTALQWAGSGSPPASAGNLVADARERLVLLGLSRADIARVEKTGAPLRSLPVRAPATGYVTARNVVLGAYVQPGTALFEIADLATVWLLADVFEQDIGQVAPGQAARLTVPARPNQPFSGTVDLIYPSVDPSTRTVKVRVVLKNPELRLLPNMFGDVAIEAAPVDALVVPREAVVDGGEVQYVFVALAGGRFEPRRVVRGLRVGDDVQIVTGVSEGETVVTTANFLIDSESRLRAAIQGQTTGGR